MTPNRKTILTGCRFIVENGEILQQCTDIHGGDENMYFDLQGNAVDLVAVPSNIDSDVIAGLFSPKPTRQDPVDEISTYLKNHIHLNSEAEYALTAVICILSYCVDLFERVPYLWIRGEKGSGKTTLMTVMKSIVLEPFFVSETTASALFRIVDYKKPTLFLDESENLAKRLNSNQPLCQILNSGYEKNGSVLRTQGRKVITYKTFGLKVLAGINPFFPTLADRCIVLELSQPPEDNNIVPFPGDQVEVTLPLVELIRSALKHKLPELMQFIADPKILGIDSKVRLREFDKWFPLLAIAKLFSSRRSDYFTRLQNYALEQISRKQELESELPENMCKAILKDFLAYKAGRPRAEDDRFLYYSSDEIYGIIKANDPHNTYKDKGQLTRLLKNIGVETDRRRFSGPPVSLYKIPKSFLN